MVDQLNRVFADQGLPSGYPDFGYPPAGRDGGDPEDLFIPQNFGVAELRNPFLGHAVPAAEIAAVGNGNPEIIDFPVVGVDQGIHCGLQKAVKKKGQYSGNIGQNGFSLSFPIPGDRAFPGCAPALPQRVDHDEKTDG
jgi:hypothetical protein